MERDLFQQLIDEAVAARDRLDAEIAAKHAEIEALRNEKRRFESVARAAGAAPRGGVKRGQKLGAPATKLTMSADKLDEFMEAARKVVARGEKLHAGTLGNEAACTDGRATAALRELRALGEVRLLGREGGVKGGGRLLFALVDDGKVVNLVRPDAG